MNNKKTIKVLYVEDEPFLGKIVKESLESRRFDVNMVADGLHVLPAFEQYRPDICILDVMLPNKDGFTLGKEIRKRRPDIPIIFLTAKNQVQDLLTGFSSGGNDYIKKPFSMEELIVRIENLLQLMNGSAGTSSSQTDLFRLGQYQFNARTYELSRAGEVRKLSHREAQLLGVFASNRNQVVERKEILMKIWGDDSFFNSRNLDVYIKKLRSYLAGDPTVQLITLKGVGYRFAVE